MLPVDSDISTSFVVPFIVTLDLTPEPEPPAVKLRTALLPPPAATGNVYVSCVLGAKAIKLDTAISFTVVSVASSYNILSAPTIVVPLDAASITLFAPA